MLLLVNRQCLTASLSLDVFCLQNFLQIYRDSDSKIISMTLFLQELLDCSKQF